jgi:hypothetical protein
MFANRSKGFSLFRSLRSVILFTAVAVMALDIQAAQAASGQGPTDIMHFPELEAGFHLLYELRFAEARAQFEIWQKAHPEGALGYASEAASYLFEECYRQGVMTSEFFLDDKRFLGKTPLKPDPDLRAKFFASDKRAQDVAGLRLKANPDNPTALFAMSMSLGMEADYASLVDKRQLDSLKKIREADTYSNKLLKVAPDAADAYLGLGTANYIIGSLPGPKKFFLGFTGVHGDKKKGIEQLEIAATRGHYLRPFAKVLLALTALREKKPEVARTEFTELVAEFPKNPLFARELAKLASKSAKVELLRSRAARAFGLANKLGSGFAHLVIAPVVALVFGGVGSFIGRLRSSRKTSIVPLKRAFQLETVFH